MLREFTTTEQLRYGQLMDVYEQLNGENAEEYRRKDRNAAIIAAEQEMYAYLKYSFFKRPGAFLAVWEDMGKYVSSVRVEPYMDGWLINALETARNSRRKGYARRLLTAVLQNIDGPVYSHVHKSNEASLKVHLGCGFSIYSNESKLLNGTVSGDHYTLLWAKEK